MLDTEGRGRVGCLNVVGRLRLGLRAVGARFALGFEIVGPGPADRARAGSRDAVAGRSPAGRERRRRSSLARLDLLSRNIAARRSEIGARFAGSDRPGRPRRPVAAGRKVPAVDLRPVALADTDAVSTALAMSPIADLAVADVDVAAVDVDVAAVDGDVAAVPVDVVVDVPAVPVIVVEDFVEDDGAAQDDAARDERVVPAAPVVMVVVSRSRSGRSAGRRPAWCRQPAGRRWARRRRRGWPRR